MIGLISPLSSVTRKLSILAALVVLLNGCALFGGKPPVPIPPSKKTGDIRQDLINRADSIKSLQIKGRLYLRERARRYPSFNCSIWFLGWNNELYLRIRGMGPFGVCVFDLLADRREAWIYLPEKAKVLRGNTFFTSYGNIDVVSAIRLMEICLNPWSPVRICRTSRVEKKTGDHDNLIASLNCLFLGQEFSLNYELPSLAPLRFDGSAISIVFKPAIGYKGGYPQQVSFSLWREGIEGRLVIKDIRFNTLSAQSRVFDKTIFNH